MNLYRKINKILLFSFVLFFPILPTYGKVSSDLILYVLAFLQVIGFFIFKQERQDFLVQLKHIFKDKVFITLLLLNITMYASTFIALDKRIAFTNSIRFSMYIYIFYYVSYKLKEAKDRDFILISFLTVSIFSSIITLFQIASSLLREESINSTHRLFSFLENPNNLGAYSILSIFIFIMLFLKTKKNKFRIIYCIATLLLLVNIIASQSRNALLALLLGSIIISLLYNKKLIIFATIIPIILIIIPQSRLRLLQVFDLTQNSSRLKIWKTASYMIKDNPLTGIGYENFPSQYEPYVLQHLDDNVWIGTGYTPLHPHNIFLKMQTELGIIGSVIFILFLISCILLFLKVIKSNKHSKYYEILIGISTSFIVFQFMNLIDCFYNAPKVILSMFLILALANNIYITNNKKNEL